MADSTPVDSDTWLDFWERRRWRLWLGLATAVATAALIAGAFLLDLPDQVRAVQFMIPPYSYACLGLAVIALTELGERLSQRLCMAVLLAALAPVSILSYAVGGVGPLFVLGTHVGCMIGWVARRRRLGWTILWFLESSMWIAIATFQGRLSP